MQRNNSQVHAWHDLGEMSVDSAAARFDGKWILMRVTKYDRYHSPDKGFVVAVNRSRNAIQPDVLAAVDDSLQNENHYYIFKGFKRIHSGAEWAEALKRIAGPGEGGAGPTG